MEINQYLGLHTSQGSRVFIYYLKTLSVARSVGRFPEARHQAAFCIACIGLFDENRVIIPGIFVSILPLFTHY